MVGIPVGSSLVGFHLSSLLHYLGSFLPQEWIPDNPFSFSHLVGNNLSSLLHLSSGLLVSEEALVKSLTCKNLELYSSNPVLPTSADKEVLLSPSQLKSNNSAPLRALDVLTPVPSCALVAFLACVDGVKTAGLTCQQGSK
ncbi:hypothetical protein DSO57_1010989 [Entomophthora muscae]|uniref:Uncharacterized protein n=1 Tax=Entomophthora muscae TaxID=34485 RepID=A0ACC2UR51_9FUNG|nr:hypothetical protein DSO57_1010989 [Entomophthora muscae]